MAKSFSIKLGADTKDFLKEMRKADAQISLTQKSAQALDKSLDFGFDSTKATLAQKQFQTALELTERKAEALKNHLKILENGGRVDSSDYIRLQTELVKTETQAIKLKQSLEEVRNVKIEQIATRFKDTGEAIEKAGQKLAVFSAAAAGAIVGAVKLAKDAVETGDNIRTMADQYDMSTKAIQRWQYVAMQTDVESATLLKSIQKTQAAFGEQATGGTTAAVKALEALGLSYQNFDSNEEMFQAVIDSLSGISDKTVQVAYATDILGERYASALVPMLQSKDAIADYIAEFERVGYLSEEEVNQLADLDNEVNKVTAQWELAKTQLGAAMIPIYETLVKLLEEKVIPAVEKLAAWFDGLSPAGQNAALGLLAVIAVVAPLLILVGKLTTGIGGLIKAFPLLKSGIEKINTPLGKTMIVIAAIAATIALINDVIKYWGNMNTFQKIVSVLGIVAVAALGAAIAFGAFHSAWSLGLAVAGIVTGIAAVTAAVNAAKKGIENVDVADFKEPDITGGKGYTDKELADLNADINREIQAPSSSGGSTTYQSTEDNSSLTVNVYVTEPAASAEDIAKAVSREIATLSQARG